MHCLGMAQKYYVQNLHLFNIINTLSFALLIRLKPAAVQQVASENVCTALLPPSALKKSRSHQQHMTQKWSH